MPKNQKPVVHIVFGMSAAGSLRQAIAQLGLGQRVIGLPDDLSFGPINPPTADLRAQWIDDILGYDDFAEYALRADLFWKEATGGSVYPVVWVCRRCAQEYAGFLEFLWRIGEQPFQVIDITEVEFITRPGRPGPRTWITPTFGYVTPNDMIDARLLDRQTTLSEQQIDTYRRMWGALRYENTNLRIVTDDGLRSADITHFDDAIASCVTPGWQKCVRVVAETLGRVLEERFDQCGDLVLWSRVRTLADEGVFEMKGNGAVMHESYVRLPPNVTATS